MEPKTETRMGNNWKSQTLLVGMKKGTSTLKKSLAAPYKVNHTLNT